MSGRRRKSGGGRMDAAVDHFAPMGYNKADVRNIINGLIKNVYGKKGWLLLEDNCYQVVQEALFEKQEQEEKLMLQQQEEEPHHLQEVEQAQQQEECEEDHEDQDQHVHELLSHLEWEQDGEEQQKEAAMMVAPLENDMPIVEVHDEAQCEALLAIKQREEEPVPMIVDPASPESASPHPAATGGGHTRRPYFGWISESESDSDYEDFLATRQQQVHVPSPGGV